MSLWIYRRRERKVLNVCEREENNPRKVWKEGNGIGAIRSERWERWKE